MNMRYLNKEWILKWCENHAKMTYDPGLLVTSVLLSYEEGKGQKE